MKTDLEAVHIAAVHIKQHVFADQEETLEEAEHESRDLRENSHFHAGGFVW